MYTALESGKILLAVFFLTISQINVSGQTISFLSYTDRLVEETTVYEKGNDYQKDVLLFCNLIGDTHPAFAGNSLPRRSNSPDGDFRSGECRLLQFLLFFPLSNFDLNSLGEKINKKVQRFGFLGADFTIIYIYLYIM